MYPPTRAIIATAAKVALVNPFFLRLTLLRVYIPMSLYRPQVPRYDDSEDPIDDSEFLRG